MLYLCNLHNVGEFNAVLVNVRPINLYFRAQGGIKAVVWTDVLQAAVMVASVVLVAMLGITNVGGLNEVWDRAVAGNRIFPPM